ncbi:fibrobacter succinogenes major paralogous domain-containing protein [bacterium]|nr:fibrobacter succinogenes major paralogous domain-containing protein [bacterium]
MRNTILFFIFISLIIVTAFNCDNKNPTENKHATGTVTDIDGNTYQTIKIGSQWWMAENLKVKHYRNGDLIPYVPKELDWYKLYTHGCCIYDSDTSNFNTYGLLYNWHAVNDWRDIAPEGWHVPSEGEWQTLMVTLGGDTIAGGRMKESGTAHWNSPNTGATNESGFSGLPCGIRSHTGQYSMMGEYARFWSSTELTTRMSMYAYLGFRTSECGMNHWYKEQAYSVRCVKDE